MEISSVEDPWNARKRVILFSLWNDAKVCAHAQCPVFETATYSRECSLVVHYRGVSEEAEKRHFTPQYPCIFGVVIRL